MGFLDSLINTASTAAEKSRKEIGKHMRYYRYYSKDKLEEIARTGSYNLYQKSAACNLLAGEHLELMDEYE
jgi:hypothetical protein